MKINMDFSLEKRTKNICIAFNLISVHKLHETNDLISIM